MDVLIGAENAAVLRCRQAQTETAEVQKSRSPRLQKGRPCRPKLERSRRLRNARMRRSKRRIQTAPLIRSVPGSKLKRI